MCVFRLEQIVMKANEDIMTSLRATPYYQNGVVLNNTIYHTKMHIRVCSGLKNPGI
jgi:hypothetical protein